MAKLTKAQQRRQASFNDAIIEDKDVAAKLKEIVEGEAVAIAVRKAKREVKKLIEAGYQDVINADRDGEHSGFVVCGGYRFLANKIDTPERAQKAKTIPSSTKWLDLDVHRADLFNAAGGSE